jgi:hypothetical protein
LILNKFEFSGQNLAVNPNIKFQVEGELFHADGQKGMAKVIVAFCVKRVKAKQYIKPEVFKNVKICIVAFFTTTATTPTTPCGVVGGPTLLRNDGIHPSAYSVS